MPICYGKVTSCKPKPAQRIKTNNILSQESHLLVEKSPIYCLLCCSSVTEKDSVTCIKPNCFLNVHLICLAKVFSKDGMILPVEGTCPTCKTSILWGDLIRKKKGCYQNLGDTNTDFSSSDSDI